MAAIEQAFRKAGALGTGLARRFGAAWAVLMLSIVFASGSVFACGIAQAAAALPVAPSPMMAEDENLPDWLRRLFDPSYRSQSGKPEHVIIGLDLSKSNPLVDDPDFALKVATYVRNELTALPARSKVTLRTFGVDSAQANRLGRDRIVTNADSATDAAQFFYTIIRNVPTLVQRGTIEAQNYTNIISFLNNASQVISCSAFDTRVILATDGIEDSEFTKLRDATARLPAPPSGQFQGCGELLMLGIGQGQNSPTTTARLRREWLRWSRTAGFETFRGLNNW